MSFSVKVTLLKRGEQDEIRRFNVDEGPVEFGALKKKIAEIFPGNYDLMWKDVDGDMVTFSSGEELQEAMKHVTNGVLKVFLDETPANHEDQDTYRRTFINSIPKMKEWKRLHKAQMKAIHSDKRPQCPGITEKNNETDEYDFPTCKGGKNRRHGHHNKLRFQMFGNGSEEENDQWFMRRQMKWLKRQSKNNAETPNYKRPQCPGTAERDIETDEYDYPACKGRKNRRHGHHNKLRFQMFGNGSEEENEQWFMRRQKKWLKRQSKNNTETPNQDPVNANFRQNGKLQADIDDEDQQLNQIKKVKKIIRLKTRPNMRGMRGGVIKLNIPGTGGEHIPGFHGWKHRKLGRRHGIHHIGRHIRRPFGCWKSPTFFSEKSRLYTDEGTHYAMGRKAGSGMSKLINDLQKMELKVNPEGWKMKGNIEGKAGKFWKVRQLRLHRALNQLEEKKKVVQSKLDSGCSHTPRHHSHEIHLE